MEAKVRTCFICDKPLKKHKGRSHWWKLAEGVPSYGFGGNNYFCTQAHAIEFAVLKASAMGDEQTFDEHSNF